MCEVCVVWLPAESITFYYGTYLFFFSSRRRHTRCALVTGVQTCALPIFDTFLIQDEGGAPFDRADRIAKLASAIERALGGTLRVDKALEARKPTLGRRQRALKIPPRVLIDNKASVTHTVVEVNGRDEPGVLWRMTRALEIGRASCRERVCQWV